MGKKEINININPQDEKKENVYTQAVKWVTKTISDAKWSKIIKVYSVILLFLVLTVLGIFFINASKHDGVVNAFSTRIIERVNKENLRQIVVTPKIQHDLEILTYTMNADRVFVLELHNGKENTSSLPFHYADMSYEEVNENKLVDKIALRYQNVPLTLYKFPTYLQTNKVFIGSLEELGSVDKDLAEEVRKNGGAYLCLSYIVNGGIPIGFFGISYHNLEDVPNMSFIKEKINETTKILSHLLDLQEQMKNKK